MKVFGIHKPETDTSFALPFPKPTWGQRYFDEFLAFSSQLPLEK